MFSIGDKIVYPMCGAGFIEDLEEKLIDGNLELYYVLNIPVSNLKVMISASKAKDNGIRAVYPKEKVIRIIKDSAEEVAVMSDNWTQRYKENMEKIKSGRLDEVALVFTNLLRRENNKPLSSAEKKMLTTAKQIIISEIALSQNIDRTEAEGILFSAVEEVY